MSASQPTNHEQNRKARATAMVRAAKLFEEAHGTPAVELVRTAGVAEWHYLLKMSYAIEPIASKEEEHPSEETKELVRFGLGILPEKKCGCGAVATRTNSKSGFPGTDVCGGCWARKFVRVVEEVQLTNYNSGGR